MAQNIITVPGLFDNDMAFIAQSNGTYAVAVNKAIIVTDSLLEAEEYFGDASYIVATDQTPVKPVADEVMDLTPALLTESGAVRAVEEVAQMVLIAGEPGPRAVKFLERLVAEDKFTARQLKKGAVSEKVARSVA